MRQPGCTPIAALALLVSGCESINNYLYPTTFEKAHIIGVECPKNAPANTPIKLTVWLYQPSGAYRLDPTYAPGTFQAYSRDGIVTIRGECSYTPPKVGEAFPKLRLDPYIASVSIPIKLPYGNYLVSIAEDYYYRVPVPIVALPTKQAWDTSTEKYQALPPGACSFFSLFTPPFGGEVDLTTEQLAFSVPSLPSTWTSTASNTPGFELPPIQAPATGSITWPIRYISNASDKLMTIY